MDRRQVYSIVVATIVLVGYGTWRNRSRTHQNVWASAAAASWSLPNSFRLEDLGTSPEGAMHLAATVGQNTGCSFEIMIDSPSPAKGVRRRNPSRLRIPLGMRNASRPSNGVSEQPSQRMLGVGLAFLAIPALAALHVLICGRRSSFRSEAGQPANEADGPSAGRGI
jgi:hypothetical protein